MENLNGDVFAPRRLVDIFVHFCHIPVYCGNEYEEISVKT